MSRVVEGERKLKAKVLERLRQTGRFGPKPLIASEFCIGSTGIRADLIIASRTTREFAAIEIKSSVDTLKRLPSQVAAYVRYFDYVMVVGAHRHQSRIRRMDVPGLEIWEAEKSGTLAVVRAGDRNAPTDSFEDLMTQRDVQRYRTLLNGGPEGIRDAFFATFDERFGPTSEQFWSSVGRGITTESLSLLSRFEAERQEQRNLRSFEARQLSSWAALEAA